MKKSMIVLTMVGLYSLYLQAWTIHSDDITWQNRT